MRQVATSVQYSTALTGVPVLDCGNQHLKPVSAFGHQLLVPPTLACALGQGLASLQGLPVFDGGATTGPGGGGNVNLNAAAAFPANMQLPPATAAELSQMGFVSQDQRILQQQQQQQLLQPLQQQQLHDKVQDISF